MINRNDRKLTESVSSVTIVIVDRLDHLPLASCTLAETSDCRPLPSLCDRNVMISRSLSSTMKKSVSLTPPVRKRDASTGRSVGVRTSARTTLPRLPVPPLRSTLDKYLQSIKPLLLQDDLRGVSAFDSAYQQRVQWAEEFETGIGATLQVRLVGIHRFLSTTLESITYVMIRSPGQEIALQLAR